MLAKIKDTNKTSFMSSKFESISIDHYETFVGHRITIDGFPLRVERNGNWDTCISWLLPNEYDWEDFLGAIERAYQVAEDHGYPFDDLIPIAIASPALEGLFEGEFRRPLIQQDIEDLDITLEQISFARTGGDLAHFYLDSSRLVGTMLNQTPHNTRTAYEFIQKMLPSSIEVSGDEIKGYIEALERAPDQVTEDNGGVYMPE